MEPDSFIRRCEVEEDCAHLLTFLEGVLDVLSEESYLGRCRFPAMEASLLLQQLGVYHRAKVCVKEAFHNLVWNVEEGDGSVSLWVIQWLVGLRGRDDFNSSSPYLQELGWTETEKTERTKPLYGFVT